MKVEVKGYIVPNDDKEVYDWFGIGATCPADIMDAIEKSAAASESVDVKITTCYGGSVFAGSEIYAALKDYAGDVNIAIMGLAASAASIIAMAGTCEMSPTAMLMVHRAAITTQGNYREMDTTSGMLQQIDKALSAAYTTKSGMAEEEALAMMDAESWLTAQQALEKGLIDKVMFTDPKQMVASISDGMIPRAVIEKTRNMLHPSQPAAVSDDTEKIEILKAKLALQLML